MRAILTFRKAPARLGNRKGKAGLRLWQVWPLWLLCAPLVLLGVLAMITVIREGQPHKDDVAEVQLAAGQDLRVALDKLDAGRLYLFSYAAEQGRRIRFAVQRTGDGAVRSTLTSCQACYRSEHPHYTLNGQVMCGTCNHAMHRPDERGLTPMQKQCTLIALPHSVKDDQLLVPANEVMGQVRALEAK